MKILVIDDEPRRATAFVRAGHDIRVAHGFEQIQFLLRDVASFWKPDLVVMDHDMPLLDGQGVLQTFGLDISIYPVLLWSCNPVGSQKMLRVLEDLQEQYDLTKRIHVQSFCNDPVYAGDVLKNF